MIIYYILLHKRYWPYRQRYVFYNILRISGLFYIYTYEIVIDLKDKVSAQRDYKIGVANIQKKKKLYR